MRVYAPAPLAPIARALFDSARADAPVATARPLSGGRRERRLENDRRRLLLAVPPAIERRLFDRRAADRANDHTQSRTAGSPVRKGLLIDVYV